MSRFITKRTDKKVFSKQTTSQKENSNKVGKSPTLPKCSYHNCKNTFIGRYTVDLDINGLYYCKEHENDVWLAMFLLTNGNEKLSMKILGIPIPKKKSATKKQR